MDLKALNKLVQDSIDGAESADGARKAAREPSLRAIRALEAALRDGLANSKLRSMVDLAPGCEMALLGIRVRGKPTEPLTDRPTLVLLDDGSLVMAHIEGPVPVIEDATDEDLRAEDLEHVGLRIAKSLQIHLAKCDKTANRFGELRNLANKIVGILDRI